jgi:phenylacetic acid degradation operon negative regulatory protein
MLAWWGFGLLTPGVWISPHPLPEEAEAAWDELEVRPYLEVFRVDHLGPGEPGALVDRAWQQIPEIAARYQGYLDQYQ